jgi:hypothetical protein
MLQPDTVYASYSWSNGSTGPSLSVSVPGTYWLDVPSGCGVARDSIVVSVVPDTFDLGPDLFHCLGDSSLIMAPMNYQSYAWSNGNIGSQDWIQNGGIYTVSVLDGHGCTNTDSVLVSIYLPDTTLLMSQICSDSSVMFNGQLLNLSGVYSQLFQNLTGCDSLVILTLQVNSIPVVTAIDTFICSGECVALYALGAQNYIWQDASAFGPQNTVCPTMSSSYSVQGVSALGCTSLPVSAQVNVEALLPPNFSLDPLQLELSNPTVTISNNVNPNQTYNWVINGESFVNNSAEFTWDLPMVEGVYVIELTTSNELGCSQTISRTVEITNTVSLYIPNSFTPDGEEENATFYPVFSPGFTPENYWFAIYNRWGEIVFESYDVANGWDGYLPYGIKCPVGVYTYVLRYGGQEDGQWDQFYGFVNLIR